MAKLRLSLKGLRILAIDDEPDVRDMLQTLLQDCGANVLTVASAREGLEALTAWKPHVLISDIGMPGEDGYSLIRKIRALSPEQGANVPAIALTGYVRVEERMRALEAGYQMFVPKPVETNELIAIIGDLLVRTISDSRVFRDSVLNISVFYCNLSSSRVSVVNNR